MEKDVLDRLLKGMSDTLDTTEFLIELLKKEPDNINAQALYNYLKDGGKCDAWECNPSVTEAFDKKLTDEGIYHVFVACSGEKPSSLCITKDEEREKIHNIRGAFLKEQQFMSHASVSELKQYCLRNQSDMRTISNLSKTRTKVFQEEAKAAGFLIAYTDNKDGSFDVHYSKSDNDKAKVALMKTIEATRGAMSIVTEQRHNDFDLYANIVDPHKDFYVVSPYQPNEYFHFTPEGCQHYRNDRLIGDDLRSDTQFQQNSHNSIEKTLISPVVLEREEYEKIKDLPAEEYRKSILKKKPAVQLSAFEKHRLELDRLAHELVEFKMSMDNNHINYQDVYDSTVSFHAFYDNEIATDKRIDTEQEMAISNPKSLPPHIEATINKCDQLPIEDKEYIKGEIRKYFAELREIETTIETEEITLEDLANEDLDVVIAGYKEEITLSETETKVTEVETVREA